MKQATRFTRLALLLVVVGALALAGCGGDDGVSQSVHDQLQQERDAEEAARLEAERKAAEEEAARLAAEEALKAAEEAAAMAYNTARDNINMAMTEADAQAAYDAVKDQVTATQGASLQMAVDARVAALDMMAREAAQKMALATAAGMIDTSDLSTQALVDAARTAIAGLRQAIADAADVSEADKMMYMSTLNDAVGAVDMAQGGIDTDTRRMNQMAALSSASMDLQAALSALSGSTPTQMQLDAANDALDDLKMALMDGADLTDTEKAPYQREAYNAAMPIQTAQMAFDNAEDEDDKTNAAMMAATAAKLYQGIRAQMGAGDGTTFAATDRDAFYNAAGTAIMVSIGNGTDVPTADDLITLSGDKDTMVADNHGWEGMRYADPAGGPMVEAIVYSNVEDPTPGKKFGSATALPADPAELAAFAYQYQLTNGELANAILDANPARVDLTDVTQTAGTKTFMLPDPNTGNAQDIFQSGTFHGVPGNYICDTGAARAAVCSATVAASGFTLTGDWTFKPSNAEARVMESVDTMYASYGWWIHKSADGEIFTASAFVDEKGTVADASGLDSLNGTATYMGGAAGKYALASSTGGTNDAGHFTARAILEANFTTNTDTDSTTNAITGTIDMFIGADGMSRDWSVKLNGSDIGDTGGIGEASDNAESAMTVWTIDGTAATASGEWTGMLRNNDTGGVPQVATGTFYSEYGTAGKMVGAFGANKQ